MTRSSVDELYNCAYTLNQMDDLPNSKEKLECMLKMCEIAEKTLNILKENLKYRLGNYDIPLYPDFGTVEGD